MAPRKGSKRKKLDEDDLSPLELSDAPPVAETPKVETVDAPKAPEVPRHPIEVPAPAKPAQSKPKAPETVLVEVNVTGRMMVERSAVLDKIEERAEGKVAIITDGKEYEATTYDGDKNIIMQKGVRFHATKDRALKMGKSVTVVV